MGRALGIIGLFIGLACGGGSSARDGAAETDTTVEADIAFDGIDGPDAAADADAQNETPAEADTDAGTDTPAEADADAGADLSGEADAEADGGAASMLDVRVTASSSSAVTLAWDAVTGATAATVWFGPEPPAEAGAPLPLQVAGPALAADATSCRIDRLAAATDVFFHVEVVGPSGLLSGNAHARLPGGPRAALDDALREVHLYAPAVLELTLSNPHTDYNGGGPRLGDVGADWQGGTWTVERADGSTLAVDAVHRHSIPVGQPDYPVAFGRYGDDDIVDVDHRIFLELGAAVGSPEVLAVRHSGTAATALDVRIPVSDRYLETPVLQVNQLGYNPRATRRWAYVSGWMGDGGAVDLADFPATAEVLVEPLDPLRPRPVRLSALPVTLRAADDPDSGGEVREIDLAALPAAEGVRYRVRLPGVGVSWPTAVSEEAAFRAFYVVWRGLYHNRWCGALDATHTEWTRPPDHCVAYWVVDPGATDPWFYFAESTSLADPRPLVGGHHDAGDFDIRPYHVVVAQYLMRAFELAGTRATDGQLTLPESGNGIPDVLDEALWSVAAWRQLQNADGSVRFGVQSWRQPEGYYYANDDELPYWTLDATSWHTAYVSGLFAQAAFLVAPYDATRSADLEAAARAAYAWAAANGAPDEYLLYGASELYRLTGEASFATDYRRYWDAIDVWGCGAYDNVMTMPGIYPGAFTSYTPAMADFTLGYLDGPAPEAGIVTTTFAQLDERAADMAGRILDSDFAHRHGRGAGQVPDWGMSTATGRNGDMIYQRLQLGGLDAATARDDFDALSLSADYVLGCNPASTVYITGLGSRHPEQPLHVDSLAFIQDAGMPPIPGIPTYGPVQSMPGSYWYDPIDASFYPTFGTQPVGFRLSDTRGSVNMSEFSVWEMQAPLAELFAALLGPGMSPPADWLPGGAAHRATLPSHVAE